MVKHLMDEEGNILSFANFHERFPNVGLDFLTYHGLVSSVMTYQKKAKFVSENSALPLDSDSKPWSVILKRGSRGVYSILNEYSQTPKSVCKWNQLFAELNWGEIFCKPIITTKRFATQMVSVQDFAQTFTNRTLFVFETLNRNSNV